MLASLLLPPFFFPAAPPPEQQKRGSSLLIELSELEGTLIISHSKCSVLDEAVYAKEEGTLTATCVYQQSVAATAA